MTPKQRQIYNQSKPLHKTIPKSLNPIHKGWVGTSATNICAGHKQRQPKYSAEDVRARCQCRILWLSKAEIWTGATDSGLIPWLPSVQPSTDSNLKAIERTIPAWRMEAMARGRRRGGHGRGVIKSLRSIAIVYQKRNCALILCVTTLQLCLFVLYCVLCAFNRLFFPFFCHSMMKNDFMCVCVF